ncbi:MAG: QueT transporter family protein [Firmicutes bacterium]|nr:QueT transporter family protein [Bacillota bacterium]
MLALYACEVIALFRIQIKALTRAATIAGLYVVLCYALAPISFGPVQLRVAEALTVLPILYVEAVPALFIGCLLANIIGGLGPWDIFGGSLVTLIAAAVTYRFRHSVIAYLSPIVLNGLLVSAYLSAIFKVPYVITALSISASEAIVVLLIGVPLIRYLRRRGTPYKQNP